MITDRVAFRRYDHPSCLCPVTIVTPPENPYIHNFFDVPPISRSGRFLACLKLPFQDRLPGPEDIATVCVVDLEEKTISEIYRTRGWGMQVGAHICWGPDDDTLLFNDKDRDRIFAIEYNVRDHTSRELSGPIYQISADGRYIFSPDLNVINHAQLGYGATLEERYVEPPPVGYPDDIGLWRTDVATGERRLIFSYRDARELMADTGAFAGSRMVFFHVKVNRPQDRLMLVVRCGFDTGEQKRFIVTMDLDGGHPLLALPFEMWLPGSHHPDWHPDGRTISMNLQLCEMRFTAFSQAFENFRIVCPHLVGGGHPSYSGDGRYLLTDAYTTEGFGNERGEVPLRLIDVTSGEERKLCYFPTIGGENISAIQPAVLRLDPHPAWCNDDTRIVFNAAPDGMRQVLLADVSGLV